MKTDDLIELVSCDARSVGESWWPMITATLATVAVSALILLATLGPRADLGQAWSSAPVLIKWLLALVAALPAWLLLREVQRPEVRVQGRLKWFLVPLSVALSLAVLSLAGTPAGERLASVRGQTLAACLVAVPIFALPMLGGLLWALRRGAVTDAVRTGLLAGLCAGALSAIVYGLHCTEDDPAFFGIWYSVGVLMVMAVGGLFGPRVLRW